jgi:iron(III) transport system ATP-binding protein
VCDLGRFPAPAELCGDVDVIVRPEAVAVAAGGAGLGNGDGGVAARVVGRTFYGHDQLLGLELAGGRRLRSRTIGTAPWQPGDDVRVHVEGDVSVLPASR